MYANRAAYDFYGYSEDELLSLSVYDICPLSKNKITEFMKKVQNNTQQFFTVPHCIKSGEVKMVDVYSSHVQYDNMSSLLSVIFDVTDREKAFEEVKNLAYHDYLTNTYNRRYLEEAFRRKNKEINCPISFIMADINGLKLVNDNYGHFIGDELIKKTAEIIKSIINDEAILARLGGDEFGVLYTQTTKDEIAKINSKLEDALESYIRVGNNVEIYLSVALGYATQSQEGSSLDYLMKTAESYLHRRKYLTERSMHSSMIHAMMSTLFLKSEREQMHSNRVGKYCAEIATALDWPRSKVNLVRVAGILHDIGKIGIDEKVLNKKAKLNEEEWALMKQHSVKSAKILDNVEEYKNLTQIVIAHHERFDGKGYPHKLKNDEIPIEARVIAVADAYDAMIEERPYKKSLTKKEAINELIENSGTQFDPLIVDIFNNKDFPTH